MSIGRDRRRIDKRETSSISGLAKVTSGSSLQHKTAIGAVWLVAWRMVTRFLGLASTLVVARILLPADFGLLGMATTFAAAIEALSQLGLQDALVRHPDGERLRDTAFTLQLIRAIITGSIVALAAPIAAWWFSEPRLIAILLVLAMSALVAGVENIGIFEFRRDMRFDREFIVLLLPRIFQIFVTIMAAIILHSYWALLIGIVFSRVARTLMTYAVHPFRPRFSLANSHELAGFSFWSWATSIASVAWDRCDPFVLGPVLGATGLGIYLQALDLAALPASELIGPAATSLFAGLASAQRDGMDSRGKAPLIALTLLSAILPIVITLSCGSGYVVAALLGPKWTDAQQPIAILAWLGVFSPFSFVVSATLVAYGLVRRNFVANVLASTIKLGVLITTVSVTSRTDMIALASTACVGCESVVFLALLPRGPTGSYSPIAGGIIRSGLAAALAITVLAACGLAWRDVSMPSPLALLFVTLIGVMTCVVYTATLFGLWFVAGRPDGPEWRLIELLRPLVAKIIDRPGIKLPFNPARWRRY